MSSVRKLVAVGRESDVPDIYRVRGSIPAFESGKEAYMAHQALLLAAKGGGNLDTILWVIAAVLVIAGIVTLFRGAVLGGVALIVLGLLVGPGGVSIFD
jgi:hypothetical protein